MRAYFKGDIGVIDKLPVETTGTPFQNSVWQALRKIGSGTHHQLCRAGAAHRQAQGGARGRPRQRPEPDQHRRALPSRDRLERHPDRLRRRPAAQEVAAGARRGLDTSVTLKSVPATGSYFRAKSALPYPRSRTGGRPTGPRRWGAPALRRNLGRARGRGPCRWPDARRASLLPPNDGRRIRRDVRAPLSLALLCPLGGACIGMALRHRLPEHHLSRESVDVIKLAMGLMATLVALTLGLLIQSASPLSRDGRDRIPAEPRQHRSSRRVPAGLWSGCCSDSRTRTPCRRARFPGPLAQRGLRTDGSDAGSGGRTSSPRFSDEIVELEPAGRRKDGFSRRRCSSPIASPTFAGSS